jgi:hypothetical protein
VENLPGPSQIASKTHFRQEKKGEIGSERHDSISITGSSLFLAFVPAGLAQRIGENHAKTNSRI